MHANEYAKVLTSNDDPVAIEYPVTADYEQDLRTFRDLATELQRVLGAKAEIRDGMYTQDATFLGDIDFRDTWQSSMPDDMRTVMIRVSNWGNLATLIHEELLPSSHLRDIIVSTVERHGYSLIPAEVLEQPYTGENPVFVGESWFTRYFDWW